MACRKRRLISLFWIWFFLIQADFVLAQDLYISWVTATPNTGQAEDSVTLQARIGNHGPGTALVIQVQWFLSADGSITTNDMALGDVETLSAYLYQGEEITITKEITAPPFQDLDPPSFLGLIIDPYEYLWDQDRSNNSGAADFTYTGGPPHSFSDPIGDNYLDVTHVKACISGENLEVTITFLQSPPATVSGIMAIDLDQNPLTGLDNLNLPGAEAVVGFLYHEYQSSFYLLTASGTTDLFTLSLNDNQLSYSIPLSLLENDTNMDLYWVVDNAVGAITTFDRAPDTGAFATDTDTVVVRHPGDTSIDIDIADPIAGASEPDFPNVKRLQAKVIGDQLHVILTYNHQVENLGAYPGSDGLFVWIDLDSDYSLCTGFTSTEERPPAFGIDYELRLQVDPLAGTVAELLKDENGDGEAEVIPMGLP